MCSSPGLAGPERGSRWTAAAFATERSAKKAATSSPICTASMRSTATVTTAVTTSTTASARVEVSTARRVATETIRTAVTMRTPASAASGMAETGPVAR
ncbi:hypothetical protein D3C74_386660 [compost metagenome]